MYSLVFFDRLPFLFTMLAVDCLLRGSANRMRFSGEAKDVLRFRILAPRRGCGHMGFLRFTELTCLDPLVSAKVALEALAHSGAG